LDAKALHQPPHVQDVPDLRDIVQHDGLIRQHARRQHRQCSVLVASRGDLALKRDAAVDYEFFHGTMTPDAFGAF